MVYTPEVANVDYQPITDLADGTLSQSQTIPSPFLSTIFGARMASRTHLAAKGFVQSSPLVNYTAMGGKDVVETTISRHYGGTAHPVNSPFDYSFVKQLGRRRQPAAQCRRHHRPRLHRHRLQQGRRPLALRHRRTADPPAAIARRTPTWLVCSSGNCFGPPACWPACSRSRPSAWPHRRGKPCSTCRSRFSPRWRCGSSFAGGAPIFGAISLAAPSGLASRFF